jgi:phthiodiolone/phenolphthiodiolone dimycocerosates ketoreductase
MLRCALPNRGEQGMSTQNLEVAIPVLADRHFPISAALDVARAVRASGTIDYIQGWDHKAGWSPPSLWTAENAPLHAIRPDSDSLPDQFAMLSAMAVAAPGIGTTISTDSIRKGPAELMQTMLTMANITEGKAQFHIGAGEIAQCNPYGWKRSEGMRRLEDTLRIAKLFWEEDEPFSFDGHFWKMDRATLGSARRYKPQIWGIGGGPKMIDLTTSYAEGFGTMAPWVAYSPERWHELVTGIKQSLERKGRDPEDFAFGVYASMLLHEDPAVIQAALENPLVQWMTACLGRFKMADWQIEGIEPPLPLDWHYSRKLLAHHLAPDDVQTILGKVTPQMSKAAWFTGGPAEVAGDLQGYVDAGATWISMCDILPMVLPVEQAPVALTRSFDLAGRLRANAAERRATPAGLSASPGR